MKKLVQAWVATGNASLNSEALGDDLFVGFEVEMPELDTVIRLQAYRKKFSEMLVLHGNKLETHTLFNGKGKTEEITKLYASVMRIFRAWHNAPVESKIRQASIVHNAGGKENSAGVTEPLGTKYIGTVPVYKTPIGHHQAPVWQHKNWPGTTQYQNQNIQLLGAIQARVFPRYARKPYAGRKVGEFIGLGGPDAKLFKHDQEAVRFIRDHYRYNLVTL